jgi:hypothetical protein
MTDTEQPIGETEPVRRIPGGSRTLLAVGAAVVVFAAVGAFVWTRSSSDSNNTSAPPTTTTAVPGTKAEVVSAGRLRALAAAAGRSIYWAGPRPGTRLEYTQKTDGTTYVRYLTGSAAAGAPGANYVVIATYPQPNALTRVKRTAEQRHYSIANLPGGAIAVTKPGRPENMYVVYPGRAYQIEVYSPRPAETRAIVFGGAVQQVP